MAHPSPAGPHASGVATTSKFYFVAYLDEPDLEEFNMKGAYEYVLGWIASRNSSGPPMSPEETLSFIRKKVSVAYNISRRCCPASDQIAWDTI